MKSLVILCSLFGLIRITNGCSCFPESLNRPRAQAIVDSYRSQYASMVYSGRVVEVSCNCYDPSSPTELTCIQYNTVFNGVQAQVSFTGICNGTGIISQSPLNRCDQLNTATSADPGLEILPAAGGSPFNLTAIATGNSCPYTCQFNFPPIGEDFETHEYRTQPCQYEIELIEVFKPANYDGPNRIRVFGPDVLTSCGQYQRVLAIGESYIAGLGGPCDPISPWSTLDSYSDGEILLLRQLRAAGGAVITLPSLLLLVLVTIMAVLL